MSVGGSIIFQWREEEVQALFDSCKYDTATPYIEKYIPRDGLVIEAGCGVARFVNYLIGKGWNHVIGIEYSVDALQLAHAHNPKMNLASADILRFPFATGSASGIISLGVIEHFPDGPEAALRETHRILCEGGVAIITVPSFNLIRQMKHTVRKIVGKAKADHRVRNLFGKSVRLSTPTTPKYLYYVFPCPEDFFEYRLTKSEFENVLLRNGFALLESAPICQMDGIYHEFWPSLVKFKGWRFYPTLAGSLLNWVLGLFPFVHNHMHLCAVRKVS